MKTESTPKNFLYFYLIFHSDDGPSLDKHLFWSFKINYTLDTELPPHNFNIIISKKVPP